MKFNFQPVAPTQEELAMLQELHNVSDPSQRLAPISNGKTYYQLKKDWLMCTYFIGLNDVEDYNEYLQHVQQFDADIAQLQQDYERDLNLVLHYQSQMQGIWLPWLKVAAL